MRYGFIGCGNMGGAVARAVCRGVGPENVVLANRTPAKCFTKFFDTFLGYLLNIDIRYHCQERLPTNVFHIEAA